MSCPPFPMQISRLHISLRFRSYKTNSTQLPLTKSRNPPSLGPMFYVFFLRGQLPSLPYSPSYLLKDLLLNYVSLLHHQQFPKAPSMSAYTQALILPIFKNNFKIITKLKTTSPCLPIHLSHLPS